MWKYLILIVLLCHFQKDQAQQESPNTGRDLAYLQILTTNGFYAPLSLYAKDENTEDDWPEGMGLLPKLGKLQQYELGKYLRKRYNHFITSNPGEVDAFSSFEDRSTISLLSLMASLYAPTEEWQFVPGFKWQPIVLSYMEEDDIEKAGLKVPRWARMYLHDMKRITDYAYTWNYNTTSSLQLKVGALIDLITVRMRAKALPDDPSPEIKVSVYVTHDWNLAALLSAMQLSNGMRPPPCATITFEMYREGEDHTVRTFFFNDTHPETGVDQEPHPLVLDGCTEYCPLSTFVQFFHNVIPDNYTELCGDLMESVEYPDEDEDEEKTQSPLYPLYQEMKDLTKGVQL
ncbi:lysosomal acid phosphatase [Trichonephila inaurata madagascariensis]|uniref:2-phosphoxylose phosphatase 1 n=1 Tax=Trichonephila inaurata madagascariensis TaxID=2747483 RepID=A0A8X6X1X8_9ARAC|nr:lysosomal acid phosphatase [Trichonephila inaurata madagascariensis]